jgi:hypothetical protein
MLAPTFHSVPSPLGPLLRCPPPPVNESYDVSEEETTVFFFGSWAPEGKKNMTEGNFRWVEPWI